MGGQLVSFEIPWEVWPEKIVTAFLGAGWCDIHNDDIKAIKIVFLDELASKFWNLSKKTRIISIVFFIASLLLTLNSYRKT